MRALDPGLAAHIASGATTLCDCWLLETADGARLGFTDHDRPLSFEGATFAPEAALSASAAEAMTGAAPGSVDVAGALRSEAITVEDVARGRFDGARLTRWRVNWAAPEQRVLLFAGTLGAITVEGGAFRAEALGPAAALNRPLGRAYLATCDATLGDRRCGVALDAPALRAEGAVLAVEGPTRLRVSGLEGFTAGWFARGALTWISGANAGGRVSTLADSADGAGRLVTLAETPALAVSVGDGFTATAGCDRRFATCREKFGNHLNFRGFPHMPGDDWIAAGPRPGGGHDGSSRLG